MTTLVTSPTPPPAPVAAAPDETVERVSALLIRIEAAAPRPLTLRPLADLRPLNDGAGGALVFATVFVDCADGQGAQPHALHELRLAAACLHTDPPFPAAPSHAPALTAAVHQAATAARLLQGSLN